MINVWILGESLKKSNLMDSSSDIMNMEEGGPVYNHSRAPVLEYNNSKVG